MCHVTKYCTIQGYTRVFRGTQGCIVYIANATMAFSHGVYTRGVFQQPCFPDRHFERGEGPGDEVAQLSSITVLFTLYLENKDVSKQETLLYV